MIPVPVKRYSVLTPQASGSVPEVWLPQETTHSFQVVEYIDSNGKVVKSRLEVCTNYHDANGTIEYSSMFTEVPRIQKYL